MARKIDMRGQRFGKLVVIDFDKKRSEETKQSYFLCVCDCGKKHVANGAALRGGKIKSCGCGLGRPVRYTAQYRKRGCDVCADAKDCPKEFCIYEKGETT